MSSGKLEVTDVAPKSACATAFFKAWHGIEPFCTRSLDRDMFRAAVVSELNRLPDDAPATVRSAVIAAKNLAQIGLIPGDAQKLAWFVPYKLRGVRTVTLVIGYRGYIELAFAGKFLRSLHADVVCQGETCEYWKDETGPRLKHVVSFERDLTWESIRAAYCIYHTVDGGHGVTLVQRKALEDVRRTDSNSPWLKYPVPMSAKTAVRRAANEWPQCPELKLALYLEELTDLGRDQVDVAAGPPAEVPIDLSALPEGDDIT